MVPVEEARLQKGTRKGVSEMDIKLKGSKSDRRHTRDGRN